MYLKPQESECFPKLSLSPPKNFVFRDAPRLFRRERHTRCVLCRAPRPPLPLPRPSRSSTSPRFRGHPLPSGGARPGPRGVRNHHTSHVRRSFTSTHEHHNLLRYFPALLVAVAPSRAFGLEINSLNQHHHDAQGDTRARDAPARAWLRRLHPRRRPRARPREGLPGVRRGGGLSRRRLRVDQEEERVCALGPQELQGQAYPAS